MANNADSFRWPPAAIDMLRAYWAQNASASYIAGRINAEFKAGITRNAVIGKVSRLGLRKSPMDVRRCRASSGRANGQKASASGKIYHFTPERAAALARARKAKAQNLREETRLQTGHQPEPPKPYAWTPKDIARPKRPIPAVHVSAITGAIIPGPDPLPPTPVASLDPRSPTDTAITLEHISSKNCCWPVTDGKPEWLFCGESRDPKSGKGERGYCTKHLRWSVSSGLGRKRADVSAGVE